MNKFLVCLALSLALVGAVDARTSSFSSSRSSTPSRGISLAKPAAAPAVKSGGINLTKPAVAAPAAAKPAGINLNKSTPAPAAPTQSRSWFGGSSTPPVQNRTVTVVHEHHYFGGGYGSGPGYYGGYRGGFGSSPFFWLWMFDRPQPQTVIVNGQPTGGASGSFAPVPEVSGTQKFFNVLIGVLLIAAILGGFTWLLIKSRSW